MQPNSTTISIFADYREKGGGVIEALRSAKTVSVEIGYLQLGDYRVNNRLLVERKTLPDFISSIKDGRIFRQAIRLASSPLKTIFILEGVSANLKHSKMSREAVQGTLISLSLIFGIPVIRSINPEETARLMLYAFRQFELNPKGAHRRSGFRPKRKKAVQLHILQGLPLVGVGRARLLLNAFGSVEGVFSANAEELIAVEGIGNKTAEAIRWAVSETKNQYKTNNEVVDIQVRCNSLSDRITGDS
jgi:DNA excision repair protein ERCC-4